MAEHENKPEDLPRRVIPKFSSFKPAVTASSLPTPEPQAGKVKEEPRERDRAKEERSHRRRSRSRSCDRRRKRDRDVEGRRHRHRSREKDSRRSHHRTHHGQTSEELASYKPRHSQSPAEGWDAPEKQYVVDTKGDPNNLVYGTIHRYSIPDYRRGGAGSVMGLPADVKIDRDKGDGGGLVLRSQYNMSTRNGEKSRRRYAEFATEGMRRLRIKKGETGLEEAFTRGLDFVPFSVKSKKRKSRDDDVSADSEEDEWADHYRSVEGLKKSLGTPGDRDLEYASESQSEDDYVSNQEWGDQQYMGELARKVEADPKNAEAWLAYVDQHDKALNNRGRRVTMAERTSTAEIKLDILTKALDKCPGQEELLLKYMAVAESIWDSRKILNRWKQVLVDHPTATGLWTTYLNFRQTDFLSFTYPSCLQCFQECLAVLRAATFKHRHGSDDTEKLEDITLYVILRATILMRDAGYKENAIAVLQAILELNIFRPPQLVPPMSNSEHEALLEEFEKFWDSEVLRVGEPNARGWSQFVAAGENGESLDPMEENFDLSPLDPDDPFGSWAEAEKEWMQKIGMPARTTDNVAENDPYRVVLFSDLKPFLFCFSSQRVSKRVIDAFLVYHNLPLSSHWDPVCSNNPESTDPFLRNDLAAMKGKALKGWFWPSRFEKEPKAITWGGMEPERTGREDSNLFYFRPKNFPVGPLEMFGKSGGWFHRMDEMGMLKAGNFSLVEETVNLVLNATGTEDLALYHLALVWENRRAEVKKVAKSLLKRFKTSLRLWSAYAQIEWYLGNVDAARNVFSTALKMINGIPENSRRDGIVLWNSWIWEEVSAGNYPDALRLALSVDAAKPLDKSNVFVPGNVSGAVLLKARRYLHDQQNAMFLLHPTHAGLFNETRALLEYLAHNRDIEAVLPVYDDFITELETRGMGGPSSGAHEQCLLRKARLLYHHFTTVKLYKMGMLRSTLEGAISLFPQNTALLSLDAWNESRTKIENRLRTVLRDRVLVAGKETVIGWLFSIWTELQTGERYNVHAVRAMFERAVECPRTSSSVQLWMLYVEFELREKEPRRAKEALFRGVRNCPWSKDLIMLSFTKVRPALEFEELRKLLSIMSAEKELRVHDVTEVEDLLEDLAAKEGLERRPSGAADFELKLPDDPDTDDEMVDQ